MKHANVVFQWTESNLSKNHRSAVSLHSHTMHSHESLDFIPPMAAGIPLLGRELSRLEAKYKAAKRCDFDFRGSHWIPPVTAPAAYELERAQIESRLDMGALVSLTDHDTIEAGCQLQSGQSSIPISLEWTVPIGPSYFHLGVHNLPSGEARKWMSLLSEFSTNPIRSQLRELLRSLTSNPEVLVVFNHPFWDQSGQGPACHLLFLSDLWTEARGYIHAVELNGLRPCAENRQAAALGRAHELPLISGGDRHGLEPNAIVNLTNSATFSEFVAEVRAGVSHVLFMSQYQEPLSLRCLRTLGDVLRTYPDWAGYERWSDRIYYSGADGSCVPISSVMNGRGPAVLKYFVSAASLLAHRRVQRALTSCCMTTFLQLGNDFQGLGQP